jgi:hypothetical protein
VLANAGRGFYWNGLDFQAPGVIVPLTTRSGSQFPVTFGFVTTVELRAKLG